MAFDNGQSGKKPTRTLTLRERINATAPPTAGMSPDEAAVVQQSEVGLRDAAIKAGRKAPSLRDRINATAAGTAPPEASGALGNVGKLLLNNPIAKIALGGITLVDAGRRATISAVREGMDLLDSDPNTKASFTDWRTQKNDTSYGFGTAFPMKGKLGRLVGFIGDVALDPITYMSFGASVAPGIFTKIFRKGLGRVALKGSEQELANLLGGARRVAGKDGKAALARAVLNMGGSAEVAKDIMVRGRLAVPEALWAQVGAKKPGVYFWGARVYAPGSKPVFNLLARGMIGTKNGLFTWSPFEKLGREFTTEGVSEARKMGAVKFGLSRGKFDAETSKSYILALTHDQFARQAQKIGTDLAISRARPLLNNASVVSAKNSVYRLLETSSSVGPDGVAVTLDASRAAWAKAGLSPSQAEIDAFQVLDTWRNEMHKSVNDAMKIADKSLQIGFVPNWFPHMATERLLEEAGGAVNQHTEQIRKYLKIDINAPTGSMQNRGLQEGSDWFGGHKLTAAEASSVDALNALAYPTLGFNYFETDMLRVLKVYSGHFGAQMGTARFMGGMIADGVYKVAYEANIVREEVVDALQTLAGTAKKRMDDGVTDVVKTGRNLLDAWDQPAGKVTGQARGILVSDAAVAAADQATTLAGGKAAVKAAKDALPKGTKNLGQAQAKVAAASEVTVKNRALLQGRWTALREIFHGESEALKILDKRFVRLMAVHDKTLADIARVEKQWADEGFDAAGIQLEQQLADVRARLVIQTEEVKKFDAKMKRVTAKEDAVNQAIQDSLMTADDIANETLRSSRDRAARRAGKQPNVVKNVRKALNIKKVGLEEGLPDEKIRQFFKSKDKEIVAFLKVVDPFRDVPRAKLAKLTMGDVIEILTSGQAGAAHVEDVRAAGIWMVMRDTMIGQPAVGAASGRTKNLTEMLLRAREVEFISKHGRMNRDLGFDANQIGGMKAASGASLAALKTNIKGENPLSLRGRQYIASKERLGEMAEVWDTLAAKGKAHAEVMREYKKNVYDWTDDVNPSAAEQLMDSRARELTNQIDDLDLEMAKQRVDMVAIRKKGGLSDEFMETVATLSLPNGLREFTENLSTAVAEYRIHSQVQLQFDRLAEEFAKAGLVPGESLYNDLLRTVTAGDLESARQFNRIIGVAGTIMDDMADVLSRVHPDDKAANFRDMLVGVFNDATPEGLARARALSAVFPEIEAVTRQKMAKSSAELMANESAKGGTIAREIIELSQSLRLQTRFGQTGKAPTRGAGLDSIDGLEMGVDRQNVDTVRRLYTASLPANKSEDLYQYTTDNIKGIQSWLRMARVSPDDRVRGAAPSVTARLNKLIGRQKKLVEEMRAVKAQSGVKDARIAAAVLARKKAADATKAVTGVGIIASKSVLMNRGIEFADYSFMTSLKNALNGSGHATDEFFAKFRGGSMVDYRTGYTTKVRDMKTLTIKTKSGRTTREIPDGFQLDAKGNVVGQLFRPDAPRQVIGRERSVLGQLEGRASIRMRILGDIANEASTSPPGIFREGLEANRGGMVAPSPGMLPPEPVARGTGEGTGLLSPSDVSTQSPTQTPAPPASFAPGRAAPSGDVYVPGKWVFAENLGGVEGYLTQLHERTVRLRVLQQNVADAEKSLAGKQADYDAGGYLARKNEEIARITREIAELGKRPAVEFENAEIAGIVATGKLAAQTPKRQFAEELKDLAFLRESGEYTVRHEARLDEMRARWAVVRKRQPGESETAIEKRMAESRRLQVQIEGRQADEFGPAVEAYPRASVQYKRDVDAIKKAQANALAPRTPSMVVDGNVVKSIPKRLAEARGRAKTKAIKELEKELADTQAKSVASTISDDIAELTETIHMKGLDVADLDVRASIAEINARYGTKIVMPDAPSLDDVIRLGQETKKGLEAVGKRLKGAKPAVATFRTDAVHAEQTRLAAQVTSFDGPIASLKGRAQELQDEWMTLTGKSDAQLAEMGFPTHVVLKEHIRLMRDLKKLQLTIADSPRAVSAAQVKKLAGLTAKEAKLQKQLIDLQGIKGAGQELVALQTSLVDAVIKFDAARLLSTKSAALKVIAEERVVKLIEIRDVVTERELGGIFTVRGQQRADVRDLGREARSLLVAKNVRMPATFEGVPNTPSREWADAVDYFLEEVRGFDAPMTVAKGEQIEKLEKMYIAAKAELLIREQALTVADRDLMQIKMLRAFEGKHNIPGWTSVVNIFDVGFVQLSEKYYPNIAVRTEIAGMMQNVHRLDDSEMSREFVKFLHGYTRLYKAYATLSPGFHARNAMSNAFMLFAAGGNPIYLAAGARLSHSWAKAHKAGLDFEKWVTDPNWVPASEVENVRKAFGGMVGSGGGLTDEAFRNGALEGDKINVLIDKGLVPLSRKFGTQLEMHSRFMLSYDGARAGLSPEHIVARTQRFLVDYEDISRADKFMREIIPFWMWTSRNLPLQVQAIFMNPKPYQVYGSIKRNLEDKEGREDMPSFMKSAGNFKLPFGNNLYATPDLGFNRLPQFAEDAQNPSRLLSNVNPAFRVPMEMISGKSFFSGREFSERPMEVSGGAGGLVQPLMAALGYGSTSADGRKFIDDDAFEALKSLMPLLGRVESIMPSTDYGKEKGIRNALMSIAGLPFKTVKPGAKAATLDKRKRDVEKLLKDFEAINKPKP